MPLFLQLPPRRSPLITWLQWPLGLDSWVPQIMVVQETILGRLPSARALNRQQTEAHLPVYERGFIASPGASAWRPGFRFGTHLTDYVAALKKCRLWTPSWCSPSALLQLTIISLKRAYVLFWSPRKVTVTQLILPDHLASRVYACGPTGRKSFAYY